MASKKTEINFNEFWPFLKELARNDRKLSHSRFMAICNIPRQRYYEFGETRNLTGIYMAKIMEGLKLSQVRVERGTGLKFTDEQEKELKIGSWPAVHRDLIEALVDYPEVIPLIFQQVALLKKK
jgi:hypothetical protein